MEWIRWLLALVFISIPAHWLMIEFRYQGEDLPGTITWGIHGSTMLLMVATILHPRLDIGYGLCKAMNVQAAFDVSNGLGGVYLVVAACCSMCYRIYALRKGKCAPQFVCEILVALFLSFILPVY